MRRRAGTPVAFVYHGFARAHRADDEEFLFVTEARLNAQLDLLARRGWRALDVDAFLAALDGGSARGFLLTIDDGYASVLTHAAPLLAARGIPSVLFVPPALAGRDQEPERILNADELRRLAAYGVELGAHGLDHRRLAGLPDAELERQVAGARAQLAELAGVVPRLFSYPYGSFDDRARRAVEDAGYEAAFAVERGAGRYALPRIGVYSRDGALAFRLKLLLARRGPVRLSRGLARVRSRVGAL